MITQPTINSRGEKRIGRGAGDERPYFGCAYDPGTKKVIVMTIPIFEQNPETGEWELERDGSLQAGTFTDTNANKEGFMADSFLEQWQEVERLGLNISDEVRAYIESVVLPLLGSES